jgi:DNA invertase Pin-like site-specific DNA recombinase
MASLLSTESGRPPEQLPRREPVEEAKPPKKTLSRALSQIAKRALEVDPREVDLYNPRELDVQVAEAFLAGYVTYRGIAKMLDCPECAVKRVLKDPVMCAWVSRTVHRNIQHRLGLVDAAVLQRAMCGDTRAADLLYKRYGQMANVNVNLNANVAGADLSKMGDADLLAMVNAAQKEDERTRTIDVEVVKETPEPEVRESDL